MRNGVVYFPVLGEKTFLEIQPDLLLHSAFRHDFAGVQKAAWLGVSGGSEAVREEGGDEFRSHVVVLKMGYFRRDLF